MTDRAKGAGLVLVALAAAACGITGSGSIVSEMRDVGGFDRIEVSDGIVVEIVVDPAAGRPRVESFYDDNLQERIVTERDGDTLRIGASGELDVVGSGRRIEITLPSLSGLAASGGSRVTATGDLPELTLEVDGGARADLSALVVGRMHLSASGGAEASVHVTDRIEGDVSGGAGVELGGDPASEELNVSGGGGVR